MTHDCHPRFSKNHFLKFASNTAVVVIIQGDNELAYRDELKHLVDWCEVNNLILIVDEPEEIIFDFRKSTPLLINDSAVGVVSSKKFLGVQVTDKLTLSLNTTSLVKKPQQ